MFDRKQYMNKEEEKIGNRRRVYQHFLDNLKRTEDGVIPELPTKEDLEEVGKCRLGKLRLNNHKFRETHREEDNAYMNAKMKERYKNMEPVDCKN